MIRVDRWSIPGPVSALRALREPRFRDGQIRHYEPAPGVGGWALSSADLTSGHRVSGRVSRWFTTLMRPEPRLRSITTQTPSPGTGTDSGPDTSATR